MMNILNTFSKLLITKVDLNTFYNIFKQGFLMNYDIFNGDADGIIALLQLRLANPIDSKLVTGVKRDIKLVQSIDVQAGDSLTVLDISMVFHWNI